DGESDYPSYPRIGFGWNPWNKTSAGTDLLPRQIRSVSSLVVSFDKSLETEGLYNTAFDIWLTGPEDRYANTIAGEIMIWLDATKPQSATLTAESIPIDAETYDFYKNTSWNDFPYLAFVKRSDTWHGHIDLMPFITYLVDNNHLSADSHIAEVEFGNEIWSGSGKMVVNNFSYSIE
ncbi:MAG: hypothetical protein JXX14_03265, partial [Deltaproteobacteria bacterium]|nr:hypothetical protein [Deltaproteobacteria bacterium]